MRFITDSGKKPAKQQLPLLVIGAGLPRSSTSSMQAAFEELGFAPCMHVAGISRIHLENSCFWMP
jgi:hypothetical protein